MGVNALSIKVKRERLSTAQNSLVSAPKRMHYNSGSREKYRSYAMYPNDIEPRNILIAYNNELYANTNNEANVKNPEKSKYRRIYAQSASALASRTHSAEITDV